MPWNPQLTQLRNVLAELYPDVADARRVASTAQLPISRIVLQGRAVNVWHAILEEADKQGQVEAVIRVALDDYPSHAGLRAAAQVLKAEAGGRRSVIPQPSAEGTGTPVDRNKLLEILTQRLSASDLRTLCFDLHVDYEDLPGESKPDKARELIQYLQRRTRVPELVEQLRRSRPDIFAEQAASPLVVTPSGVSSPPTRDDAVPGALPTAAPFVVTPSGVSSPPTQADALTGAPQTGGRAEGKTVILLLASDPTDAARLRLGQEFREIQEKLQLSKQRDRFELQMRLSARPMDISQALLDIQPQVVHFAGHGEEARGSGDAEARGIKLVKAAGAEVGAAAGADDAAEGGALYFEDAYGQAQAVSAEALAALFEVFAGQVQCVVLNACYSEGQARAIARHVPYVVGMRKAIGDRAAIAFSIGFYQALGAGRPVEQAYKLGCVQIGLQGIPEHLTPILIRKDSRINTDEHR